MTRLARVAELMKRSGMSPFLPLREVQELSQPSSPPAAAEAAAAHSLDVRWITQGAAAIVRPYYRRNIYHHFQSLAGLVAAAYELLMDSAELHDAPDTLCALPLGVGGNSSCGSTSSSSRTSRSGGSRRRRRRNDMQRRSQVNWLLRLRWLLLPAYDSRNAAQFEWSNSMLTHVTRYIDAAVDATLQLEAAASAADSSVRDTYAGRCGQRGARRGRWGWGSQGVGVSTLMAPQFGRDGILFSGTSFADTTYTHQGNRIFNSETLFCFRGKLGKVQINRLAQHK